MVSSAVALRLRPAALMVFPDISSSPPLMSPIAGSSVTRKPHLIRVDFIVSVPLPGAARYAAAAGGNNR